VNVDEFDSEGRWTGTCDRCGTSHPESGLPLEFFAGAAECLSIQSRRLGREAVGLVEAGLASIRAHNLDALRAAWNAEPPQRGDR
jgi:hypothetical protein